ncbi:MAG TPA: Asp-tRNA(Asn)/Glu-tRNA(Gln) amidotransferase subunit GatB [Gemmatimonadales bacterium]|nr:Asp-tRNA(Asn)/Glu-tRNA(Gln) amidotransferase subunit GatB [Gemmatimonadales bacterium]
MEWETVIGLEVHVQLATVTKMFCACRTSYGEPPNTVVCPTCLGLPGALPAANLEAVRLGVLGARALGCTVHQTSVFARKNYFYPDLPKGYQISQFDKPLATDGAILVETPERGTIRVGITRLHLEEDAGKSLHDRIPGQTAIDLNRAGTPLAEIVGFHDLRSPAEARAYLTTLRQLLVYAGVSECSMEKGSLRVDANLSVRRPGAPLGTKTEVKNMNSFANVERALESERTRQIALLEGGESVEQVTLTFNAATGAVKVLRVKEDAHDYRYFPDPDLPPMVLESAWLEARDAELPELPTARQGRFRDAFGLPDYDVGVLTAEPVVADYVEAIVTAGAEPKVAANWVMGEAMARFKETGTFAVTPDRLAALITLQGSGFLSGNAAKEVFREMVEDTEADPKAIAIRLGVVQVQDAGALEGWVDEVLAAHPGEVERYKGGDAKLIGFFVGQVMKRSRGKADPKGIQPILAARLDR